MGCRVVYMFCEKCGKPIDGDNKFCMHCGTPVDAQAEKNTIYLNTQGAKPAKKKLGAGKIALIALAVLVLVGGILLALNFDTVRAWFTSDSGSSGGSHTGSSGQSSSGSQQQQIADIGKELGEIYGDIINPDTSVSGAKGTIKVHIGEMLENMLTQYTGVNMKWVDGIGLQVQGGKQGDLFQMKLNLLVSNTNALGMDVIVSEEKIYLGIPDLSQSYLELDMTKLLAQAGVDMSTLMGAIQTNTQNLPSQEKFTQLINKYLGIIADNISSVSSETSVLMIEEISSISETVKKQTSVVNYASLEKMLTAMVAELEKDTTAKQLLDELEAYIENQVNQIPELGEEIQVDDLYNNLLAILRSLIPMVQQQKDANADWNVQMISYLNTRNELIGFDVVGFDGQKVLSCGRVTGGDSFATKLSVGTFVFGGSGTISGNRENGTYYFELDGVKLVNLQTIDYTQTNDGFTGTVRITPTEALMKRIFGSGMQGTVYALELKSTTESGEKLVNISLLINDALFAGISVGGQTLPNYTVSTPTFTVDGTDEAALQSWVMGMNIQGVITKLQSVGVPVQELLGLFISES